MRTKLIAVTVLLASLLFSLPAAAQLGDIIKKAQKVKKAVDIYTPWTPEQETAIGEASAAKMINIFGLYEDPQMVKYVNLVGNAVARQGVRGVQFHFGILDTEAVTAVSLPGGYVFLTRGALANMKNEAELAGTLAHEIAHVDRRHLEKQVRTQKTINFAKEEAASRVPAGAQLIAIAGEVIKNALTMQVSRDGENEADKVGMDLAARAGYNAGGLRDFLQVLAAASANEANRRQLGLWGSTHPPLADRVAALTSQMANYPTEGQSLTERFNWYVNPLTFNRGPAPAAAAAPAAPSGGGGGIEVDGVVRNGAIVLQGVKLPDGTKVKVRIVQ
jgi:predicted Zn-dependent protease